MHPLSSPTPARASGPQGNATDSRSLFVSERVALKALPRIAHAGPNIEASSTVMLVEACRVPKIIEFILHVPADVFCA